MRMLVLFLLLGAAIPQMAQTIPPAERLHQHKVTNSSSPAPEPGAENELIPSLVDGLKTLVGLVDDHTVIVPANGPILTKAELVDQQQMYATIFDRLTKLLRKGLGPDEVIAQAPTREFDDKWGDSRQFVDLAFKSLWGHMAPDA